MDNLGNGGHAALVQLQAFLAQMDMSGETRLSAARELCATLRVPRGDLRQALPVREQAGRIWRRVGKGAFVGSGLVEETIGISEIAGRTSPAEVMRARLIVEPEIAREAALHATSADIAAMRETIAGTRA